MAARRAAVSCRLVVSCVVVCAVGSVRAQSSTRVDAPSALAIRAPAQMTLGVDASAMIEYDLPAAESGKLTVNLGSLGPVTEVGPGKFHATYTPPAEKYPQVAIVALLLPDGRGFAWARIALLGSAQISLQSEPSVDVQVRVGGEMFGPVRTDPLGHASVPVVIPPGVVSATSIATDPLGNRTEQNTPIVVPEFSRTLSLCMPERADAFWVFAVDRAGRPLENAALDFDTSVLRLAKTEAQEPGVYRVRLDVPAGVHEGDIARPAASLSDDPERSSACELRVPIARVEGITLNVQPSTVIATDITSVTVNVGPAYIAGAEMQAIDIELEADFGRLSQTRIHTAAPVEVQWSSPKRFAGRTEAVLAAHSGVLLARARLALQPGPVAALRLALADSELRADGVSSTQLRVRVEDADGNLVPGAELAAAARGVVGAFAQTADGQFEASYRSPVGVSPAEVIEVRDTKSGVLARVPVALRRRQSDLFVGARAGYLSNFARVSGPLLLAQVGMRLPISAVRIDLGVDGGFYASSYSDAVSGGAIDTTLSAVPLLARADYVLDLAAWELRGFAGPGVLFSRSQVTSLTSGSQRSKQADLLLAAGGGISRVLGPGRVVLDLAYWYAAVSGGAVDGNAGGLNVSLGYLAEL